MFMTQSPLVSIIVPCYNQAQFLPEALDSVLAQTYQNWECVIVNDGSADNTDHVANEYCERDSRFKYLRQENLGVSMARNNGIKVSHGEFILPLDGDDMIAQTYVEKALSIFDCCPDIKLVYCKARLFGTLECEWDLPKYDYDELLWNNMIFCSAMYRRKDYNQTGGYNPNMQEGLEDWDFWLSLLKKDDVVYCIEDHLFFYRKHGDSRNNISQESIMGLCKQIFDNHKNLYSSFSNEIVFYKQFYKNNKDFIREKTYEKELEVCSTLSYKIGSIVLSPFKLLKALVNHNHLLF